MSFLFIFIVFSLFDFLFCFIKDSLTKRLLKKLKAVCLPKARIQLTRMVQNLARKPFTMSINSSTNWLRICSIIPSNDDYDYRTSWSSQRWNIVGSTNWSFLEENLSTFIVPRIHSEMVLHFRSEIISDWSILPHRRWHYSNRPVRMP